MEQGRETARAAIGVFHLHEALHMTDYFAHALQNALADHPAVKNNPEWLALCEKAGEALGELYQKIGQARLEAWEAEERRIWTAAQEGKECNADFHHTTR